MAKGAFTFELVGMKEFDRLLSQLPKAMGKSVIRRALTKAAQPVEAEYKANIPESGKARSGRSLKDKTRVTTVLNKNQKRGRQRDPSRVEVFVGSTAPHAHLVEFGTGPRKLKVPRKVQLGNNFVLITHTGQMPARPYLRQAWDAKKGEAMNILKKELWNQLMKAVQRLRKRAESGKLGKAAVKELSR